MATTANPPNPTLLGGSSGGINTSSVDLDLPPPPKNGERHILKPESELRIELPNNTVATLLLLKGSAELFGAELACAPSGLGSSSSSATTVLSTTTTGSSGDKNTVIYIKQRYTIVGQANFAILSWYGCTIDIEVEFDKSLGMSYTSEEVGCNIAYVNTNAQLEALRDEAWAAMDKNSASTSGDSGQNNKKTIADGPRVMVVGPADSGKTSLVRVLSAYAVKLGRTPLLVDIDPSQNLLSIPGTITASSPLTQDSISIPTQASASSIGGVSSNDHPLAFWYGSTDIKSNTELYKAQITKLGECIDSKLHQSHTNEELDEAGKNACSSGIIVNSSSWIEDDGFHLLLHAMNALRINVVLVMGHDRLYSMLMNHFQKQSSSSTTNTKVIKLPRSGGVVSRDTTFRRIARSQSMKRYFYGQPNLAPPSSSTTTTITTTNNALSSSLLSSTANPSAPSTSTSTTASQILSSSSLVHQYTPASIELPFSSLTIYKLSTMSLSASMLPVSAKQTTSAVQLTRITDLSQQLSQLKHSILAVCHPMSVEEYEISGLDEDLYLRGFAGMVVVEKVDVDGDVLGLLSPCSGSLPSMVLLLGDVIWME